MTGPPSAERRFLGRPEEAYPGFVPGTSSPRAHAGTDRDVLSRRRSGASRLWLVQALTGALLLVFLGIHLVAQHLLAPGGLRDYEAVVAYLREPIALAAELGLLVSVIIHACAGVRASLVEVLPNPVHVRLASVVIALAGAVAAAYAIWLTFSVLAAGGSV
jgi:succinate dehydrogenase hydrophobic anchor subunit